jgi:hypothetical protein
MVAGDSAWSWREGSQAIRAERGELVLDDKAAGELTGISHQQVSRWAKYLNDREAYRAKAFRQGLRDLRSPQNPGNGREDEEEADDSADVGHYRYAFITQRCRSSSMLRSDISKIAPSGASLGCGCITFLMEVHSRVHNVILPFHVKVMHPDAPDFLTN